MNDKILAPIKLRVIQYVEYKGFQKKKYFSELGASDSNFRGDGLKSEVGGEVLAKILSNDENLSSEWLILGVGQMLKQDEHIVSVVKEPGHVYKPKSREKVEEQSIPLYNIQASAGLVTLFSDANQQNPIDYITVPNLPKCDGAVYVTGDSMYPLLKNGDMVMYKQVRDFEFGLIWGEMYIVNLDIDGDDYISVKWLHKSEKGDDWIKLVSENRHHAPKDYPMSKVRSMALVKATLRINSMS